MYRIVEDDFTGTTAIERLADGVFIPAHEGNRDYRKYLAWVAEGNAAERVAVERPASRPDLGAELAALKAVLIAKGTLTEDEIEAERAVASAEK